MFDLFDGHAHDSADRKRLFNLIATSRLANELIPAAVESLSWIGFEPVTRSGRLLAHKSFERVRGILARVDGAFS